MVSTVSSSSPASFPGGISVCKHGNISEHRFHGKLHENNQRDLRDSSWERLVNARHADNFGREERARGKGWVSVVVCQHTGRTGMRRGRVVSSV